MSSQLLPPVFRPFALPNKPGTVLVAKTPRPLFHYRLSSEATVLTTCSCIRKRNQLRLCSLLRHFVLDLFSDFQPVGSAWRIWPVILSYNNPITGFVSSKTFWQNPHNFGDTFNIKVTITTVTTTVTIALLHCHSIFYLHKSSDILTFYRYAAGTSYSG